MNVKNYVKALKSMMSRDSKNSRITRFFEMTEYVFPFLCMALMFCFIFCRSIPYTAIVCFALFLVCVFWTKASGVFRLSFAHVQSVIFFSALSSRLLYCLCISENTVQMSDFGLLLEMAGTGDFKAEQLYYRMFPHKLFYPLFLHAVRLDTQTGIFAFQSVCMAVTAVFIYRAGKEAGTEKSGILAAVLYILWPVQVFYAGIVSEEHVAATVTIVFIAAVYLFSVLGRQQENLYHEKFFESCLFLPLPGFGFGRGR